MNLQIQPSSSPDSLLYLSGMPSLFQRSINSMKPLIFRRSLENETIMNKINEGRIKSIVKKSTQSSNQYQGQKDVSTRSSRRSTDSALRVCLEILWIPSFHSRRTHMLEKATIFRLKRLQYGRTTKEYFLAQGAPHTLITSHSHQERQGNTSVFTFWMAFNRRPE